MVFCIMTLCSLVGASTSVSEERTASIFIFVLYVSILCVIKILFGCLFDLQHTYF
jgi:hypothetical protein